MDDGVLVHAGNDVLASEWADGADPSGDLAGEQSLAGDVEGWDGGLWVDGGLAVQGDGDWSVELNVDWESHFGWEEHLDWGDVEGLLDVQLHFAGEEGPWVGQDLRDLLLHQLGSPVAEALEEDARFEKPEEEAAGNLVRLASLQLQLLDDLVPFRRDRAADLVLQVRLGAAKSGEHGSDLVEEGVRAGEPVAELEGVEVVVLKEVGDGEEGVPWQDGLLAGDPDEVRLVAGTELLQELSLVPDTGGWDDAVGLLDEWVSGPALGDQGEGLFADLLGWEFVAESEQTDVDGLQKLHVHGWLVLGGGGDGVEDVHWWVHLQESVEGNDPHLGGLRWVGEDGEHDWSDQLWVGEAGHAEGVSGQHPGQTALGGSLQGAVDDWSELRDDVLVGEEAEGDDVDVLQVLVRGGAELASQVWDESLLDDLRLWGAELAVDGGWERGLPGLRNASRLDELGEAGDGNRVGGWVGLDGLGLSDELEQAGQDLLGWQDDVVWQPHEDAVDFGPWEVSLTDDLSDELESLWGSGHDDGVQEQLLVGQLLLTAGLADQRVVDLGDLLLGLQGGHAADNAQDLHVDLGLGQLAGLTADDGGDVLEEGLDLLREAPLGFHGGKALEEGLWDGLGQNLAAFQLRLWDPALVHELLGDGVGLRKSVGGPGVLVHQGVEVDWLGWGWDGAGKSLDFLEPQRLQGSGNHLLGLGAHQADVGLAVIDNGLHDELSTSLGGSGAGAAGDVASRGGPGQSSAAVVDVLTGSTAHELAWAVEGESGDLLAVLKVDAADDLVVLLLWADLWVWDQDWVLLDDVLWELVDLVGDLAPARDSLFLDLPVSAWLRGWGLKLMDRKMGLNQFVVLFHFILF